METYENDRTAVESRRADPTEASQSAIGNSTTVDYNLSSIHRNAVLIISPVVALTGYEFYTKGPEFTGTSCI